MKTITLLLKNEFTALLSINNMFDANKGKVKKPWVIAAGAVLFGALMVYLSGLYSYMLAVSLIPYGAMDVLPCMLFVAGSMVVFFYGALKSSNVLFSWGDYDLLMSMPIPTKTIITAKLIYLYISDLVFALLIMLPCLGIWVYFAQPNLFSIILTLLALPFVPAIPLAAATIIGTIVAYFSGFVRHKALVSTAANLVLVGAILVASTTFGAAASSENALADIAIALQNQLFAQYPPAQVFAGITQGDIYAFLLFAGLSVLLLLGYVAVVSSQFIKIHSKLESASVSKAKGAVKVKQNGQMSALLLKELRLFTTTPAYLLNMGIGVIMCFLASLYVLFFAQDTVQALTQNTLFATMITVNLPFVIAGVSNMTVASSCSVSLEGKNLWFTKSLPIAPYKLMQSKIYFTLLLTLPICLLASFVAIYSLKLNLIWGLITILFSAGSCFFAAYGGLLLNLRFPNFEWVSEVKVVKQSAPVFVTTFGSMGFMALNFVLLNMLSSSLSVAIFIYSIEIIVLWGAALLMSRYLKKNSGIILTRLG